MQSSEMISWWMLGNNSSWKCLCALPWTFHFEFHNVQTKQLWTSSHYARAITESTAAFLFMQNLNLSSKKWIFIRICQRERASKRRRREKNAESPMNSENAGPKWWQRKKNWTEIAKIHKSIYWISVFNLIWFPFLCCACRNQHKWMKEKKKKKKQRRPSSRIILSFSLEEWDEQKEKIRPSMHVCKS